MKNIIIGINIILLSLSISAQDKLNVHDTRNVNNSIDTYNQSLQAHFKVGSAIGLSETNGNTYYTLLGLKGWTDNSGGKAHELAFSNDGKIFYRNGYSPNWESWKSFLLQDSNGNVGIGTINPLAKLDVNGIIQTYNMNASTAYWDNLRLWSDGENSYIESNGDEKGMVLKSNGANKISIMSNLGVGTTTPDEKLTVKGKIHAEEVRVDLNVPGPDYVFEKNYQLKSLPEIQAFIKENKHLPEIPSAKEMEKNGLNLSEMNMLLLKKIEELTLYLIEIKNEMEELKKSNFKN